jgi:hypothetical protein
MLSLFRFGTCVHEAGHFIVGMALGEQLVELSACIDQDGTRSGCTRRAGRESGRHPASEGSRPDRMLDELTLVVAGLVAEDALDNEERLDDGAHDLRISTTFDFELPGVAFDWRCPLQSMQAWQNDPADDIAAAAYIAHSLAWARSGEPVLADAGIFVVECIREAEGRAAAILKRNWPAVRKLALSLSRRKSGRMTYRQVRRLIGEVA